MDFKLKKSNVLLILLACICIFTSMSCISASDINETSFDEFNTNIVIDFGEVNDNVIPGDKDKFGVVVFPDSFDALQSQIDRLNDGDTYTFDKDYHFNDDIYRRIDHRIITIDKNDITIEGNGHSIDAGGDICYSIFKVTGKNVKINNLTFTNSHPYENEYSRTTSPLYWTGDNGVISNCVFYENTATNGGAMTWEGFDGVIDNCFFINNTATGIGGAIYVNACQNTLIRNCVFINSSSLTTGEAVFLDRTSRKTTFENDWFSNEIPFIEGINADVSIDYFSNFKYYSYVTDMELNLVPMVYSAIVVGGINTLDNGISYYYQYYDDTGEFIFTVSRDFAEYGIVYTKDYIFKNISTLDLNEVFNNLFDDKYSNQISVIVNKNIASKADYESARKVKYDDCVKVISNQINTDVAHCKSLTSVIKALNVQFSETLTISNDDSWNLGKMGFSVVNIEGHNSTIKGSFKDRDEDKWAVVDENEIFTASNIIITGFNTAIENFGGYCIFNNVYFLKNKMNYWIDRDWGAAIINTGTVICTNCTFEKNSAKNGGAIFNQGLLIIENCTFINNDAYGKGDDICVGDGGLVIIDGQNITDDTDIVYFASSMSATESTLWAMLSVATSFVVGAVAGFFTANPIIGVVVGAAIGVALGSVAAGYIISEHYDVNFNRLKTALILIVGSAVAGAAGGFMGQEIGTWYSYILETEGGFYGINWCPTLLIVGTPITVLSGLEGLIYYTTY